MSVQTRARSKPRTHPLPAGPGGEGSNPEAGRGPSAAAAWGVAGLLGLVSFAVYFRTLAPSIVGGDSSELAAAAFTAGVPHPTGYPLYMLLARAFLHAFPVGSVAYRMNLLAALSGSAAVALIYLLMLRVCRSRCAGVAATLMFAFSRTFWSQAIIAEHYTFQVFTMAATLGCVLAWDRRGDRRWLWTSAVVYGLCLTHHMMSLLLAPGLLFFALTSRHRAQFLRELRWTLPLLLLPLSLYLYLPLAALRDPPMNWGDPRTWDRFVAHVTGRQYHHAMFHMTRAQLWKQVKNYAGFMPAQFHLAFLWLAPLGAWSLARRHRRLFGLTLLVYLVNVIYALNYFIYNVEIYYLPSHLMVALWIGCGLRQTGAWLGLICRRLALRPVRRRALNALSGAALLILPVTLLVANWSANDRHADWGSLAYAHAALAKEVLKPNTILIGEGDDGYFPLLYAHFIENQRPDVTLLAVNDILRPDHVRLTTRLAGPRLTVRVPPGFRTQPGVTFDNRLLKQLVADNIDRRPIYLLASPGALRTQWLAGVTAPYYPIGISNVPSLELRRHAPNLAITHPYPRRRQRACFGLRRPDGSVENDLEFLGCDLQPLRRAGAPWLRASYYWKVSNQAVARRATIWIMFTDAAGQYPRTADGSPEFHNIHPLAYGVGQRQPALPATLRETFDLYVPPREWNQPLHVRLAIALDRQILSAAGYSTPWVEIGELPPAFSRRMNCSPTHQATPAVREIAPRAVATVKALAPWSTAAPTAKPEAAMVRVKSAPSAAKTRPRKRSAAVRCSSTVLKTQRRLPPIRQTNMAAPALASDHECPSAMKNAPPTR